jgi:hypothetical protein
VDTAETVQLDIDYPASGQGRLVTFFRLILVIPQLIVVAIVGIGAFFAAIAGWFGVLFTGTYPQGAFNFIVGTARWYARVTAYEFLLTDQYPPFALDDDPNYPVRLNVAYPAQVERWRCIPAITVILAIPVLVGVYVLTIVAEICAVVAWFCIMFTGQIPAGLFNVIGTYIRWQSKVLLYVVLVNTKYPSSPSA